MTNATKAVVEAIDLREDYSSQPVAKDSLAYGKASANASTLKKRIAIKFVAMAGGGEAVSNNGAPDWIRWRKDGDADPMVNVYFQGDRELKVTPKGVIVKWVQGDPTRIQTSQMAELVMGPIIEGVAASLKASHKIPLELAKVIMTYSMFAGNPTPEAIAELFGSDVEDDDDGKLQSAIEFVKGEFKQTVENLRKQIERTASNGGKRSNNMSPYQKTVRGCIEALESVRKVDAEKEAELMAASQIKIGTKVLPRSGQPDLTLATTHLLAAFVALGVEAPAE